MDQLADQYNERLVNIATDYQKANYSDLYANTRHLRIQLTHFSALLSGSLQSSP
jgi:hypothetical protein